MSFVAWVNVTYLDSVLDNVIISCFLALQNTAPTPTKKVNLQIEWRWSWEAQSASKKPRIPDVVFVSVRQLLPRTSWRCLVLMGYLKIHLTASRWVECGKSRYWESVETPNRFTVTIHYFHFTSVSLEHFITPYPVLSHKPRLAFYIHFSFTLFKAAHLT